MKGYNNYLSSEFINRELSWVEFNVRVLEEAQDNNNPLLERFKFLAIVSSNFDEFFMIRIASLWDQFNAGFTKPDFSGLKPKQQIDLLANKIHNTVKAQYNCFNRSLIPSLKKEGVFIKKVDELDRQQQMFVENYYNNNIYPVLTPMVVDKSRPFPLILNKSLNIGLLLENEKEESGYVFAGVQVPSVLGRFIEIKTDNDEKIFVLLEDIIKKYAHTLFIGHNILASGCFRITRNADLDIDEEGAEDLLETIENSIKQRKWGAAIRLEIEKNIDTRILESLTRALEVPKEGIFHIVGPIDLTFLMKLGSIKGYKKLKYEQYNPIIPEELENKNMFDAINEKDILLHHPYESFKPVVDLVKEAATDPNVLAIKQTLYRVSGKSPIIDALALAAENGKQVTVLLELKARFDEENNINWAKRLEKSGCHVIYGLVGLKTHCKLLLVVRKESNGIKRYVHMGTGNYNDVTANIYTDIGLFTVSPHFGEDASMVFNMLTGYSQFTSLKKVDVAPITLRRKFIELIMNETENAIEGKKTKIVAKMNSLVDKEIIETLYKASNAGVEIDLIVRGICCLRPGVPGLSSNIKVKSIVGRFLEHSRIFYFYNNGMESIYLSSADWMNRNLDRRVELLFPIEDTDNKNKLKQILEVYLSDTLKSRMLGSNGEYSKVDRRGKINLNCQDYFCQESIHRTLKEVALTEIEIKPV